MRPPSEASPQESRASPEVGDVSRQALQRPSADAPHMSLHRQNGEKELQGRIIGGQNDVCMSHIPADASAPRRCAVWARKTHNPDFLL